MKNILLVIAFVLTLLQANAQTADFIIRNGKLIDGTGNQWQYKDVAIKGNQIIAIGNLSNWKATREIDASEAKQLGLAMEVVESESLELQFIAMKILLPGILSSEAIYQ